MKSRRPISVFGFVLVLVIGLGMTLSAVQAATMTLTMATSGAISCDLCGGNDNDETAPDRCPPGCLSTGVGILSASPAGFTIHGESAEETRSASPTGIAGTPDPSPPKPSIHS